MDVHTETTSLIAHLIDERAITHHDEASFLSLVRNHGCHPDEVERRFLGVEPPNRPDKWTTGRDAELVPNRKVGGFGDLFYVDG
jgi:hypothetical protein